jgi:hypothetical protein
MCGEGVGNDLFNKKARPKNIISTNKENVRGGSRKRPF